MPRPSRPVTRREPGASTRAPAPRRQPRRLCPTARCARTPARRWPRSEAAARCSARRAASAPSCPPPRRPRGFQRAARAEARRSRDAAGAARVVDASVSGVARGADGERRAGGCGARGVRLSTQPRRSAHVERWARRSGGRTAPLDAAREPADAAASCCSLRRVRRSSALSRSGGKKQAPPAGWLRRTVQSPCAPASTSPWPCRATP